MRQDLLLSAIDQNISIKYLYYDMFSNAASAPLSSPTASGLTLYQDDGQFSTSGGRLVIPAQTTAAWGDLAAIFTTAASRTNREAFVAKQTITTAGYIAYGFNHTLTKDTTWPGSMSIFFNSNGSIGQSFNRTGNTPQIGAWNVNHEMMCVVVPRSAGAFYIVKGGNYPDWTLLWVESSYSGDIYGSVSNYSAVGNADFMGITSDIPAALKTDTGIATTVVASPATSQSGTMATGDGIIDFTWSCKTGQTLQILFRMTDANNCWKLLCSESADTIKLYKRVAGVDTEVNAGQTQPFNNGTSYRMTIDLYGPSIRVRISTSMKHFYAVDGYNSTATGVDVSGFTTGSTNFILWPKTVNMGKITYSGPGGVFVALGDSKSMNTYEPTFRTLTGWSEGWERAVTGTTVALRKAAIDTDLFALDAGPVTKIISNLGINDVASGLPVEATWKSDYTYIIDAFHTKWPSAHIYLTKPWGRGRGTNCNTLATWIDDIVASRSSFVHVGDDERTWLENGDDGATYTSDGIHYNAAGNAKAAAERKTALGL